MTPAELKTVRESLGLTAQWLADQAGVKLRTVQYWESGRSRVPSDVEQLIEGIEDQVQDFVIETLDIHAGGEPQDVELLRYRTDADLWQALPAWEPIPATAYAAAIARVRVELAERGVPSTILYSP